MKTYIRQTERQSRTWPAKKAVQPPVHTILQAYLDKNTKSTSAPSTETTHPNTCLSAIPVQRTIDPTSCTVSQNGHYLVPQANPKILYSLATATAPVPVRLYTQGADQTNANPAVPLRSWIPNVRLLSKAEQSDFAIHRTKEVLRRGLCGCLGLTRTVPDHDREKALIANIKQVNTQPGNPTTGIIGANDCGEFATYLRHLIGASVDAPHAPTNRLPNETYTGDTMYHRFHNEEDSFYHYATIVGMDGNSRVTLEAHAGRDITAPEFDIVNGITGFKAKNLAGGFQDDNARIVPLEEMDREAHQKEVERSTLNRDPFNKDEVRNIRGRAITHSVAGIF